MRSKLANLLTPLALLALGGVVGCSSEPERGLFVTRPDIKIDVEGEVLPAADQGPTPLVEVSTLEVVSDVPAVILDGEFGWPCDENDDCLSGWCVEGGTAEGVCTEFCISSCPDGWACRPISNGAEVTFICVFRSARLCWPCRDDSDCRSATADPDGICVDSGDAGAFCGISCLDDTTCPENFECKKQAGSGGQCVPASGDCACNERAQQLALTTDCATSNDFGVCEGIRGCSILGLSACSGDVPALEICNGLDDDCDGKTDGADAADCVTYYPDADGDEYGIGAGECLCENPGAGFVTATGDCSDVDGNVNPGAAESCNFLDDDCDLDMDEFDALGCVHYSLDEDGDSYGSLVTEVCRCDDPGGEYLTQGGDCDDAVVLINPGVSEKCDGIDNDCDGKTDEDNAKGCTVYYVDKDGDGYGKNTEIRCACSTSAEYVTDRGGDCNDNDTAVHPLAAETCNFVDDNCDGEADEPGTIGCGYFYKDADQDTFGDTYDKKCLCVAAFPYTSTELGDCDDTLPGVRPGGNEICNGVDDDCDNMTDGYTAADCLYYFVDGDQDGFGDINKTQCLCSPTPPWSTLTGGDCNDSNPIAFPGAQEICSPGDENCNGQANENGSLGCTYFYKDEDGDGFGTGEFQCLCQPAAPFSVLQGGDCYDGNPVVHPGQGNWFNVPRGPDGNFDYNCDGNQERESTVDGGHCSDFLGFCSATQKGFKGGIPACGVYGSYLNDCDSGFFDCDDKTISIQQRCR